MATPIGTDTITSISRRHVLPEVIDQFYEAIPLFYRLDRANKKKVQGGLHIEVPLLYTRFDTGQTYRGFDLLDTTPQDVIKNAAFDWKQYAVVVTLDGLTMLRNDSPESIANIVETYFQAARMEMEDLLGTDTFSDAVTDTKALDGLQGAVDNGSVAATYGGLGSRTTTNSFWQPDTSGALDTTTTTLTLDSMQAVFQAATQGARHPTLLVTTDAIYNSYWSLNQVHQRFPSEPMGQDEQLAKAGFTNLLFNNVPLVVDERCNASHLYYLNEDYIELFVHPSRDFHLEDFQQPTNQDAMTAKMLWAGNLAVKNIARQGLQNALVA